MTLRVPAHRLRHLILVSLFCIISAVVLAALSVAVLIPWKPAHDMVGRQLPIPAAVEAPREQEKPHAYPLPPTPDTATLSTMPRGLIIYVDKEGSGGKCHLHIVRWPAPTPHVLQPKVVGKYGLGDYIVEPKFSPDGDKILFIGVRVLPNGKEVKLTDGKDALVGTDLWILDIRRNTAKPLTVDGAGYSQASWSPDGRYVCANSSEGEDLGIPEDVGVAAPIDSVRQWSHNLYVYDTLTRKAKLLDTYIEYPTWSADGTHIYYECSLDEHRIRQCLIDRYGRRRKVLPEGEYGPDSVSPDRRLTTRRGQDSKGLPILIIKTAGSSSVKTINIGPATGLDGTYRWAPDSRRIMFAGTSAGSKDSKDLRLTVVDTRTGRRLDLGDKPYMLGGFLGWARRGDWAIMEGAVTEDSYPSFVAAISARTGKVVTLVAPEKAWGFDWHEIRGHRSR